jgi:hypothetical protein
MTQVKLVHSQGTSEISVVPLITKCNLFKKNPGLTNTPYQVQSDVSLEDFQTFTSALEDKAVNITDRNFSGLLRLSEEFGFSVFLMKLSNRKLSPGLTEVSAKSPPAAIPPSAPSKSPPTDNGDQ